MTKKRSPDDIRNKNLKPVKKGEILNPKGKPKGARNRSTIFRELMDAARAGYVDQTNADAVVAALLVSALSGDVSAARELFDSSFGKNVDEAKVETKMEVVIRDLRGERKKDK